MTSGERPRFPIGTIVLVCLCVVGWGFMYASTSAVLPRESIVSSNWSAVVTLVGSPTRIASIQLNKVLYSSSEITTGLLLSVITAIPRARQLVQTELERTIAERDAFESFRRRVAALDIPQAPVDGTHQLQEIPRIIETDPSSSTTSPLSKIQQAYRETVMNVPHYKEEYDESLEQNLALEFGEELAIATTTNSHLTPYLQQSIMQAAIQAATRRETFVPRLQNEANALKEADRTLSKIHTEYEALTAQPYSDQSVGDLRETYWRLTACRTACEEVLAERQTHRTEGHMAEPHTKELVDLQEYLYQPLDVTYPMLTDGTAVLDRIETARRRVEDSLVRRL
jgi:hypothetical protein